MKEVPQPLCPEQREAVAKFLSIPARSEEGELANVHIYALLSHIAHLQEEAKKKDEALQGASRTLGDYQNCWVEGMPGHKMDFTTELAAIAAALGQTHQEGIEK